MLQTSKLKDRLGSKDPEIPWVPYLTKKQYDFVFL